MGLRNLSLYIRPVVLKKVFIVLQVLLLFAADSGQMLYAHICKQSQHVSVSITGQQACCKKCAAPASDAAFGKSNCCQTFQQFIKVGFTAERFEAKKGEVPAQSDLLLPTIGPLLSGSFEPAAETPVAFRAQHSRGRSERAFMQVFRC